VPRRALIGVGIASHPLHAAGNTWAFLQWVLSFKESGWDVWVVEDLASAKIVDREKKPFPTLEGSANLAHWNSVIDEFGLRDRCTLLLDGEAPNKRELMAFAREAEFLFNISGHFHTPEVMAAVPHRVYVDLDPAFTQIWAEVYHSAMNLEPHDIFMSIGGRLGRPDCRAPLAGRDWRPIGVPVALEHFTLPNVAQPGEVWTTFTHWYGYPAVEYAGEWYGNKSEEFEKLAILPRKTRARLEIATDLHEEDPTTALFRDGGWSLVDARPLNTPWQKYRDYAAASRGEFCVAKNGYVRSRCGWFSDRSAMYLALGRSVILQDTGWPEFYPVGEGLFAFTDEADAAAALEEVERDPVRHARAARAVAEKYCAGPVVVGRFLETAGLG
jgi:hypothetical protein